MLLSKKIADFFRFLQRENLIKLLLLIGIMVVLSSIGIAWFEPEVSWVNGIWWSVVTLTTVGYGDISPTTTGGRVIAVLIMFFGIGLLGMLSATLASVLISNKMKENKGMNTYTFAKHIILAEWNHRSKSILKELRADSKTTETPIILIADIEENPTVDDNFFFIRGNINEETLAKANIQQAKTVIVLGDDQLEATSRDAKVVLSTLTIESICPNVYTVVELVDEKNIQHCKRAKADEIIVGNELSSHLIASSAINHGISLIVSELLSTQHGNDLYSIPVPEKMIGSTFMQLFTTMKQEKQSIVLGVQKEHGGVLTTNPDSDYTIVKGDNMVVIAKGRP
jgi:voltage-gated potassium channel